MPPSTSSYESISPFEFDDDAVKSFVSLVLKQTIIQDITIDGYRRVFNDAFDADDVLIRTNGDGCEHVSSTIPPLRSSSLMIVL